MLAAQLTAKLLGREDKLEKWRGGGLVSIFGLGVAAVWLDRAGQLVWRRGDHF